MRCAQWTLLYMVVEVRLEITTPLAGERLGLELPLLEGHRELPLHEAGQGSAHSLGTTYICMSQWRGSHVYVHVAVAWITYGSHMDHIRPHARA